MRISRDTWARYQRAHALLQGRARAELESYFQTLPWDEDERGSLRRLAIRAVQLAERYGMADGELSAQFYDELMAAMGADVDPAEVAEIDDGLVARDVGDAVAKGTSAQASMSLASAVVAGHVKRAGVRTLRDAARRDGAMWAWACVGDSCAFCKALGSNGWQEASENILKGRHAEHVHDNCDCQFVVKPPGAKLEIDGYDPDALYAEYRDADGRNSKDKVNAMRRAAYTEEYAQRRNAARRELYAAAKAHGG